MQCLPVLLAGMSDAGRNSLLILELGRGPYSILIQSQSMFIVLKSVMN